jgi:hypothetical protein
MQIFIKTLHRQGTNLHSGSSLSDKSPPRTTSLRLARQVSTSHDKSPPHTTSPAPTSAWAQTHGSGEATNACGEANLHVTRGQQLAAMQATYLGRSLKCEPD